MCNVQCIRVHVQILSENHGKSGVLVKTFTPSYLLIGRCYEAEISAILLLLTCPFR